MMIQAQLPLSAGRLERLVSLFIRLRCWPWGRNFAYRLPPRAI